MSTFMDNGNRVTQGGYWMRTPLAWQGTNTHGKELVIRMLSFPDGNAAVGSLRHNYQWHNVLCRHQE
jgi:hypothetical protein